MSTAAIPLYNQLVAKGLSEQDARETAESAFAAFLRSPAFQREMEARIRQAVAEFAKAEIAQAAAEQAAAAKAETEQVVDKAIARNDEQAKAQFVKKDDFHAALRALPTREEMSARFGEMNARIDRLEQRMESGFAQQRVESKATARLIFSALISIIVLVAGSILA